MKVAIVLALLLGARTGPPGWTPLPPLPDAEGFAGAFAGVAGGKLIVAGGANFPGKKPWEGGTKVWHDGVFVLDRPGGEWAIAGKLPRPLGYGVCATHRDAVICAGGSDATRHYADAFRISLKDGSLVTAPLPPMPKPVANACGAIVGDTLYVAGGQESPTSGTALATLFALDLAAPTPAWRELEPCPGGGRIFGVAAALDGDLYVMSGASLAPGDADAAGKVTRTYLTDAWRYRPSKGWTRMADLPRPVLGAPSPAPANDARGFLVLGGDDGSQVGVTPPQGHKGFSKSVLRYDATADKWTPAGDLPAARVTTPCARWEGMWIVPTGEAFPGVRSPEVWGRP
jgi:N-acetylneuraminic acid mutarotase